MNSLPLIRFVLGLAGLGLLITTVPAVPPAASNVTALGRWPSYTTGQATDAHQINEYLYVSLLEGGFQILNVKDPNDPVVLWSLRFPGSGPVAILGRFVYVGGSELHILEVPDPTRPIYRGAWGDWDTRGMALDGSYAYLVGSRGLLVVDLSNPAQPVAVSTNEFVVGARDGPRVWVDGHYAYVVHGAQLRIIDMSDKGQPRQVGLFEDAGFWPGLYDVVVRDGLAYVGSSIGIHLIDVSNPEDPHLLRTEPLEGLLLPLKLRLLMKDNYLYAGYQGRLVTFDITDPLQPAPFPRVDLVLADDVYVQTGDPGVRQLRLSTSGELIVARGYDGVELMSLANPKSPRPVGRAITYCDVRSVRLAGNYAYILNFPAGIQVLDITVPSKPSVLRTEPFPHSHLRYQPFDSVGSLIFAISPNEELVCLDFADLSRPPWRRAMEGAGARLCNLAISSNHVAVTAYEYDALGTFLGKAYDLGDQSIQLANSFNGNHWGQKLTCHSLYVPPRWATPGSADWIKNDRLYHLDGELTISHLVPGVGAMPPHFHVPVPGCFRTVSSSGQRDYLGGEGILVLNTSEPDAPVNMGRVWTNRIYGLSAETRHLVFTDQDGLKVMEVLDPKEPHLVGYYNAPDLQAVAHAGRLAMVARGQEGLLTLDLGEALVVPPRIARDIRPLRVARGGAARFDLSALGSPPMRYQWFRNGHLIPGETNASLLIPHVTGPESGFIRAAARNEGGHASSSEVGLVINEEPFFRGKVVETGEVFAPHARVTVRLYGQDDRGVTSMVLRRNGSAVASVTIKPPEQECQREVVVELPMVGVQQFTVDGYDTEGALSTSDPFSVVVTDQPTFFFTSPFPVIYESVGGVWMEVGRVNNLTEPASVDLRTADLTARAVSERGPGHYIAVATNVEFAPLESRKSTLIRFVNNNVYQGDRAFTVHLQHPSAGWAIHEPDTRVTIQDDDSPEQIALWAEMIPPAPAPAERSSLQIRLEPSQALGKWRFLWETRWHDSSETVTGLVPGNYSTVFLPRGGYLAPEDTILTIAPGVNELVTQHYVAVDAGAGGLSIVLLPEAVNQWIDPGRWRLQGSSTNAWLESGAVLTNLPGGTHVVEFKSIFGFAAPAPQWIQVVPDQIVSRKVRYALATAGTGDAPRPVPDFRSFADGIKEALPYAFNGQLLTDVGYASGCVVRPHTVLTAAHAVFSSESLSYVSRVWWFFQKHRGEHEPVPVEWRGSLLFSGYAAARTNDIVGGGFDPGSSSAQALSLDVAAIYFDQDAGRGGYGGFTVWPSAAAWIESPSPRLALSYPVEDIPEENGDRLHQLGPARYYFANAGGPLLSSADVRVRPGSSGGPVCVKGVNTLGQPLFLPSAVQLGGTDRMIIRLIDLDVADLIVRAENASGGVLDTGGGFVRVEHSGADNNHRGGLLSVRVGPPAATRLGGAWRVSPTNHGELGELIGHTNFTSAATSLPVVSSQFDIEVRPLPGFAPPSNKLARVVADANVLLDLTYTVVPPRVVTDALRGLGLVGTPGTTYRVEARGNSSDAPWAPVVDLTLEEGTNWLGTGLGIDATGRVHRAVWLSE